MVRRGIIVVCALSASGCSPYIRTCQWLELRGDPELRVVAAREAGECNGYACRAAPGRYRLSRNEYTVEFWNGDRWYPELLVRVDGHAQRVTLRSAQLKEIPVGERTSQWAKFSHYLPGGVGIRDGKSVPEFPPSLDIDVMNADNEIIGVIQIELRMNQCRQLAFDSL